MSYTVSDNIKRVSITSKGQLTIPRMFYSMLGFGNKADCILKDNMLIIKPIKPNNNDDLSEQILSELINKGYNGVELLNEFKRIRSQIRPAVENLLKEARLAAEGKSEYYTKDEVFKDD